MPEDLTIWGVGLHPGGGGTAHRASLHFEGLAVHTAPTGMWAAATEVLIPKLECTRLCPPGASCLLHTGQVPCGPGGSQLQLCDHRQQPDGSQWPPSSVW